MRHSISTGQKSWLPPQLWPFLLDHRAKIVLLFVGLLLPLWIFHELAEQVHQQGGFPWDKSILHWLHAHSSLHRDAVMRAISLVGGVPGMAPFGVVFCALLVMCKRRGDALFFALALGGAGLLNFATKLFFHRTRPDLWISIAPEHDYGFPSGHSMMAMALAASLALLARGTRWFWPVVIGGACWVVAVGLSRLYLGVHFPSDVLGGWCASLLWVTGLHGIFGVRRRWTSWAERWQRWRRG